MNFFRSELLILIYLNFKVYLFSIVRNLKAYVKKLTVHCNNINFIILF